MPNLALQEMSKSNSESNQSEVGVPKKEAASKRNEAVTYVVIPPDGGWGWAIVFGAFFSYFVSDGLIYTFGIFLTDISESLGCTRSKVSLAGAVNTCIICISGPFSAALINRYGYRTVSFCGCVLASLGCLLTSYSRDINFVIFFHGVIGGIGLGMIYITAVVVVGFYFERRRALATGIAVCGAGVSEISLPPLFMFLLEKIGWRNTFRVLSCACLLLILCTSLFRPLKPTRVLVAITLNKQNVSGKPPTNESSGTTISSEGQLIGGKISTVTVLDQLDNTSSELVAITTYSTESNGGAQHSNRNAESYPSNDATDSEAKCLYCRCGHRRRHRGGCCISRKKKKGLLARPLFKRDIFYGASIVDLPEYKQTLPKPRLLNTKSLSNVHYQLSITTTFHRRRVQDRTKCGKISSAVGRAIGMLLDFHIIKDRRYMLFIMSALSTSLGFYTPYMFIKDSTVMQGVSPNIAFWFVSTMGLANTVGRICSGMLTMLPRVRAISLSYSLLFIGGIATILSTLSYRIWVQFVYCAVYGFSIASISALKTVIVVKLLGLKNLTNAMGILLLFQGTASLVGISISGYLRDVTNDYKCSFYFGGSCLSVGSLFLLILDLKTRKGVRAED